MFELRQMDTRIQYVENMTLESEMDIVSPDTQEMAQLKISYNDSGQDAVNKQAELDLKQEKLNNLAQEVRDKAQVFMAKYMMLIGGILLVISLIAAIIISGLEGTAMIVGLSVLSIVQVAAAVLVIPLVESKL